MRFRNVLGLSLISTLLLHTYLSYRAVSERADKDSWKSHPDAAKTEVLLRSTINRMVIIKTYMRGGSTLFGELFNQNADVLYWFEPVTHWYSANYGLQHWVNLIDIVLTPEGNVRHVSTVETLGLKNFLEGVFRCNLKNVPDESFTRFAFRNPYTKNVGDVCPGKSSQRCSEDLSIHCGKNPGDIGATMQAALESMCYKYLPIPIIPQLHQSNITLHPQSDIPAHIHKYRECMAQFHAQSQQCRRGVFNVCQRTTIKAAKVIRASLSFLEELFKENPDVTVLFYVRDPRGILNSRYDLYKTKTAKGARGFQSSLGLGQILIEAKYLCKVMMHDFEWWKILSQRYPGSIRAWHYEDFARAPLKNARDVYGFFNRTLPESVAEWITEEMQIKNKAGLITGGGKDRTLDAKVENPFLTSRLNSTATSLRWKKSWKAGELAELNRVCGDVLRSFNYEL